MLETVVALVFAHVLADFTMQSGRMVKNKSRPLVILSHIAIVTLVSWVAIGFAPVPWLILIIALSHMVIDIVKVRFAGPGFLAFASDQAAHIVMILLGATLFPGAWAAGLWARTPVAWFELLPTAMALGAGLIGTVWAGNYAVRSLMIGLALPSDPAEDSSLPRGGRLIGRLERLMILMLVLAGEAGAIGFLIAAKSVLRFNELARDRDQRIGEYVIIGTLASFAWALAVAFATDAAITALAAP